MSSKKKTKDSDGLYQKSIKWVDDIAHGRALSSDYLVKHSRNIGMLVVLILMNIGNRYDCQKKLAEKSSLKREITDLRYEALTLSAELMGASRQSEVESLVKKKGLDLEIATAPPYKLK